MQIRSIVLRGVRNFKDFEHCFEDAWTASVPDALLLIGPNGSGKTTVLDAIADLWQTLEYHLGRDQNSLHPAPRTLALPAALFAGRGGQAAIEIVGLEGQPLWIWVGSEGDWVSFIDGHADSHVVASVIASPDGTRHFRYAAPESLRQDLIDQDQWHARWQQRLTENLLGKRAGLPNIVYLPGETRLLRPVTEEFEVTPEPAEFRWLARYEPTSHRKGSIQNYLYNLKVVDETAFAEVVDQINRFLTGKRLHGFDARTGRLLVEVDGGARHPIEELSSGEKQVLLMLAAITRWLRPGGIVLVDEPDLHLHVSLTTAFVSHLRRLVAEQNGQLILASHALDLRRQFTASHLVRLGRLNGEEDAE